jgi:hypothetical protein
MTRQERRALIRKGKYPDNYQHFGPTNLADILMRVVINHVGDEKFPTGFCTADFAYAGALLERTGEWEQAWHQRIRCKEVSGFVAAAMALDADPETAYTPGAPPGRTPTPFEYQSKVESIMPIVEQIAQGQELTVLGFAFKIDRQTLRWSNTGELRTAEHTESIH